MNRRDLLTWSGATALALAASPISTARDAVAADQTAKQLGNPPERQSEEGVMIHPFESDVMRGFPPAKKNVVTPDTYLLSPGHRRWAEQHMRELYSTQPISRGGGPLIILPRKPADIDAMRIRDREGKSITVQNFLKTTSTDAFLVLHRGAILTEQYFSGMRPGTPHRVWSVGKSIAGGVVANLLAEGSLRQETEITQYVPELFRSAYRGATIRHLLDMRSGIKYEYDMKDGNATHMESHQMGRAVGLLRRLPGENPDEGLYHFLLTLKGCRPHGALMSYKCSDSCVLAWACEMVTGVRFADLISRYIWSKLGAEHEANIVCDVQGATQPNGAISTTLRDLARWGQAHLEFGSYSGHQVVPEAFLRDVQRHAEVLTNDSSPSAKDSLPGMGYRSQFWVPSGKAGAFKAWGAFGQHCYINPKYSTVIVKFSSHDTFSFAMEGDEVHAFDEIAKALGA